MVHVAAKPTSTASSHPIKLAKLKLRESGYILPGPLIYFSESALAARRVPDPQKAMEGSGEERLS
jgi:hypothetical protein